MKTCRDCANWVAPDNSRKFGECEFLAIHPINKRVMPKASIPLNLRYDGDDVEHLRTTEGFRACKGFVPTGGA